MLGGGAEHQRLDRRDGLVGLARHPEAEEGGALTLAQRSVPLQILPGRASSWVGFDVRGLGMVQRLGDLDDALAWAAEIALLAPLTIAGHKLTLEGGDGVAEAFAKAWASADMAEGRAAFHERRPPSFRGN